MIKNFYFKLTSVHNLYSTYKKSRYLIMKFCHIVMYIMFTIFSSGTLIPAAGP